MSNHDCKTDRQLREFAMGQCDTVLLDTIAEHLEVCPACCKRVDQFESDPLLKRIQDPIVGIVSIPGKFGEYDLLEEIARGGMGIVIKARQTKLDRIVALKMIKSGELASQREIQRFQSEAVAAGRLDHANIVPVFDVGKHEGRQFFAMGFVEGESLADVLKAGPVPPHEAVETLLMIARAVAYAHKQGIVHRDLKPSNILIDRKGHPRITDFGLAKQLATDSGMTATGQVLGTPSFMPPEQAAGKLDQTGPQSDQYSLGAMLYCMVTGRPPFQAASIALTLDQVLKHDPVSPRTINPNVDRDLETIILKCLEKAPKDRYASVEELVADLKRRQNGEPISARPAGVVERTIKWSRRRPALAGVVGLAVVAFAAFIALGVGGLVLREVQRAKNEAETQKGIADQALAVAQTERENAQVARTDAEMARYATDMTLAWLAYKNRDFIRMRFLLARYETDESAAYRGFEWQFLHNLSHAELQVLQHGGGPVYDISASANGRWIASASPQQIKIWDAANGELIKSLGFGIGYGRLGMTSIEFRPDSKVLACVHGKNIELLDTTTWKSIQTLTNQREKGKDFGNLQWNADGNQLQYHEPASSLQSEPGAGFVVEIAEQTVQVKFDNGESRTLKGHAGAVHDACILADGHRIATAGEDQTIRIWDALAETGGTTIGDGISETDGPLDFSADSRFLVSQSGDSYQKLPGGGSTQGGDGIYIQNVESGQQVRAFRDFPTRPAGDEAPTRLFSVGFGDKDRMVAAVFDIGVRMWRIADGELVHAPKIAGVWPVHGAALSPDAKWFATCSESTFAVNIWNMQNGAKVVPLEGAKIRGWSVAFSPDGKTLAAGCTDGVIRLWDTDTGKLAKSYAGPKGYVYCVAFSQNGKHVAGAFEDCRVRVWETETAGEPVIMEGHTGEARMVAFHPAGNRIVTSSRDGTMRIWDTVAGQEILTLEDSGDIPFLGLSFSPNGDLLATGGQTELRIWEGTAKTANDKPKREARWESFHQQQIDGNIGRPVKYATSELRHLNYVITRRPDVARNLSRRGVVYAAMGRFDAAINDHTHAVELEPQSYELWRNRASAYAMQEKRKEAARDLTKAIELCLASEHSNMSWSLYFNRANAYGYLGKYKEAANDYGKSLGSMPFAPSLIMWRHYSLAQIGAGDSKAHRTICEKLLSTYGANTRPAVQAQLAYHLALRPNAVADAAKIAQLARSAAKAEPSDYNLLVLGMAEYRSGNLAAAAKALQQSSTLPIEDELVRNCFLAIVRSTTGELASAQELIETAESTIPQLSQNSETGNVSWQTRVQVDSVLSEAKSALTAARQPRE